MKILIINVHSALNLGDDAIMKVTIDGLLRKFPNSQITIAANDPDSWRKYQETEVVSSLCNWVADCRLGYWRAGIYRMPIFFAILLFFSLFYRLFKKEFFVRSTEKNQLLLAYYQADMVLSCGGGNYYAHKSLSPGFLWTLFAAFFAILLGKPLIMLPQSIGPIKGYFQRKLSKTLFNKVDKIMLREPISFDFLKSEIGLSSENLVVLHDLAFDLQTISAETISAETISAETISAETISAEAILQKSNRDIHPDSDRLRVGITLIDRAAQDPQFQNQSNYESALESAITERTETNNADIFLFVQCYGPSPSHDDRIITNRIYQKFQNDSHKINILDSFDDASAIREAYGLMDVVIGTRMHTGVFALSQGIPAILIGYQPKAKGMMEAFGLDRFYCDIDQINPESLCLMANNLLDERNFLGHQIAKRYQAMRPIADAWLDHIDS